MRCRARSRARDQRGGRDLLRPSWTEHVMPSLRRGQQTRRPGLFRLGRGCVDHQGVPATTHTKTTPRLNPRPSRNKQCSNQPWHRLTRPISADPPRSVPRSRARSRGRTADRQPEGPTAVPGDQASDLQLPGSGGRMNLRPLGYEDRAAPFNQVRYPPTVTARASRAGWRRGGVRRNRSGASDVKPESGRGPAGSPRLSKTGGV
jgi:hypothetical protein